MAFTKQSQVRHLKDFLGLLICCAALFSGNTNADVVNDWNRISVEIIVSEVKSPSMASHVLAMTQSSVFEAVNAITREYPAKSMLEPVQEEASVEAAVASANREMLQWLSGVIASGEQSLSLIVHKRCLVCTYLRSS